MGGELNSWQAYGVVLKEPVIMKVSGKDNMVFARTILRVPRGNDVMFLPIVAYNKKAQILCQLARKGSTIFAKGYMVSEQSITSRQGKTLISVQFKMTDFEVLIKEPAKIDDADFVNVCQLYEPDSFMEGDKEEDVE